MNIQLFSVKPSIPPELRFLEDLSYNMWWCWNRDAINLFRRIDPQGWRDSGHNPLIFLSRIPQKRLESLATDEAYLNHLKNVEEDFRNAVKTSNTTDAPQGCVAYFSLEYGIHESIRIYSGGLGVLAGDHLKAASDMGLPLVAVGLMYRDGYFQQYLNSDGWQQESYHDIQIHQLPLVKAGGDTSQVRVDIPLPSGTLHAIVWRMEIGRIPLFLLDTNIPENPPDFRSISGKLYGGGRETRLRQELLLGIGGFKALHALGYSPCVCHMNEGHAAFLSLSRISHISRTQEVDLETAREIVHRTNVFTTHTPVPAGNETFSLDLAKPYLAAIELEVGIPRDQIIAWGQSDDGNAPTELSMTILGLKTAQYANGVSELHGQVSRRMWRHLWPSHTEDEVPIKHITNGIHVASWISDDNAALFDRNLGPGWKLHPASSEILSRVMQIPDEELWRAHELGRSRMIRVARDLLEQQLQTRNASRAELAAAKSSLDYDTLTVGFARRFATYKRGALLLKDMGRFEALLSNEDRPIQFVFAGKAHPEDEHGKEFIRQIVEFAHKANTRHRIMFIENYNINVARSLVQGVDVWLNTPRRPMEASGTSGMKAAANGVINLSILDGWWCEGYDKECGWAIGSGEEYDDPEYQDAVESHALYNLLENDVVPCFYDREHGDLPARWVHMMKASIRMALGFFTSHRMVAEYSSLYYSTALKEYETLMHGKVRRAVELVNQHKRFESLWGKIHIQSPVSEKAMSILHTGDTFSLTSVVTLGELSPDEVDVQVCYGLVDSRNKITSCHFEKMADYEQQADGQYVYSHELTCEASGRYGFTTRVTPAGADWARDIPGFVTWAEE